MEGSVGDLGWYDAFRYGCYDGVSALAPERPRGWLAGWWYGQGWQQGAMIRSWLPGFLVRHLVRKISRLREAGRL